MESNNDNEIESYGDPGVLSADAPVPTWLKLTYISLPIWGIISLYLFWNGSFGWWDRGSWQQLQRAANTTDAFPSFRQQDEEQLPKK